MALLYPAFLINVFINFAWNPVFWEVQGTESLTFPAMQQKNACKGFLKNRFALAVKIIFNIHFVVINRGPFLQKQIWHFWSYKTFLEKIIACCLNQRKKKKTKKIMNLYGKQFPGTLDFKKRNIENEILKSKKNFTHVTVSNIMEKFCLRIAQQISRSLSTVFCMIYSSPN